MDDTMMGLLRLTRRLVQRRCQPTMRVVKYEGDIMLQMPGAVYFKIVLGPMHRARLEHRSGHSDTTRMQVTRIAVAKGCRQRLRGDTALPTGAEGRRVLIL